MQARVVHDDAERGAVFDTAMTHESSSCKAVMDDEAPPRCILSRFRARGIQIVEVKQVARSALELEYAER